MRLPLLLSVPHAGLQVPPEVAELCVLTPAQIAADGDVGAREIYALEGEVAAFVTTDVARAFVDLNRARDDFRKDGVVKTHTCWDEPVYARRPDAETVERLLARHYVPYHARLTELARPGVRLGLDGHTMAPVAPPVAPDAGRRRPAVCLGWGDGTCPREWVETLAACFREEVGPDVTLNDPFSGGYITRTHAAELPWVQIELSRTREPPYDEQRARLLRALRRFCARAFAEERA